MNGWIYFIFDIEHNICRIGLTRDMGFDRIKSQMKYYPFKTKYHTLYADVVDDTEKHFHALFADKRLEYGSDWFHLTEKQFFVQHQIYEEQRRRGFYTFEWYQNRESSRIADRPIKLSRTETRVLERIEKLREEGELNNYVR